MKVKESAFLYGEVVKEEITKKRYQIATFTLLRKRPD